MVCAKNAMRKVSHERELYCSRRYEHLVIEHAVISSTNFEPWTMQPSHNHSIAKLRVNSERILILQQPSQDTHHSTSLHHHQA